VIVAGALFLSDAPDLSIRETITASSQVSWKAIASGAALSFFAFIGFEDMVNVAEEVKDPERNMPRAILLALVVTGLVYLLVVLIATTVIAPTTLAGAKAPLLAVVQRATDVVPDRVFTLIALFAVANTGLLNFIMGSRLIYGMSRQGLLPSALGTVHPKRRTPHLAILTVLVVALALALSGTLTYLAGTTSLLLLVVFFAVNLSLVAIKRRERGSLRTFCAPRLIPIVGALTCLALMPFVPRGSLLTAVVILGLGVGLVLLRARRSTG
jgi:APA family basic amino acid/polyamine antiporter